MLLSGFVMAFLFRQSFTTLPLQMTARGLSAAQYRQVIAVNGAVVLLLSLPLARFGGRARPLTLLTLSGILVGLGFYCTAFALNVPVFMLSVAVWTVGEILHLPFASAVVSALAPPHAQGRAQGLYGSVWGLAGIVAPGSGAWLLGAPEPHLLWTVCLLGGLLAAVGYAVLGRQTSS